MKSNPIDNQHLYEQSPMVNQHGQSQGMDVGCPVAIKFQSKRWRETIIRGLY